jgi:hypothetical protein
MKRLLFLSLLFGKTLYAQSETHPLGNWGINFQLHSNSVVFTNPANAQAGRFQSSSFLSPGIGLFSKPYSGQWLEFIINAGYQKRGSGSIIYINPPNTTGTLVDIDERYQCLNGDIQFRVKMNRPRINPFAGIGGGFNYVLKRNNGVGNNIQVEDPLLFPAQTIIQAEGYRSFSAMFTASGGVTLNKVVDFEFSAHIDQQPVLKNEYVNMWLWTTSFTIRLNLPGLIKLEKEKKN